MKNNENKKPKFPTMSERAKYEIELAKKKVMEEKDDFNEYLCMCFDAALEAYEVICKQGHSGMRIGITKDILNKLIDGEPLTAIEDTPDVWSEITYEDEEGNTTYQCKRCSALFKDVYNDGTIKYSYMHSATCVDAITGATYENRLILNIFDEMFPIKMPFIPPKEKAYIYTADFLFDKENRNFDTIAVLYIQKGNDRIEVNRFFRESYEGNKETYPGWVEIDIDELDYRMTTARVRGNTNMTLDDIGLQELCNEYYKEMDGDDYDSQFCENRNKES